MARLLYCNPHCEVSFIIQKVDLTNREKKEYIYSKIKIVTEKKLGSGGMRRRDVRKEMAIAQ